MERLAYKPVSKHRLLLSIHPQLGDWVSVDVLNKAHHSTRIGLPEPAQRRNKISRKVRATHPCFFCKMCLFAFKFEQLGLHMLLKVTTPPHNA